MTQTQVITLGEARSFLVSNKLFFPPVFYDFSWRWTMYGGQPFMQGPVDVLRPFSGCVVFHCAASDMETACWFSFSRWRWVNSRSQVSTARLVFLTDRLLGADPRSRRNSWAPNRLACVLPLPERPLAFAAGTAGQLTQRKSRPQRFICVAINALKWMHFQMLQVPGRLGLSL